MVQIHIPKHMHFQASAQSSFPLVQELQPSHQLLSSTLGRIICTLVQQLPLPIGLADKKSLVSGEANLQPYGTDGVRHQIRTRFCYDGLVSISYNPAGFQAWV